MQTNYQLHRTNRSIDVSWHQPVTALAALLAGWNVVVVWTKLSIGTRALSSSALHAAQGRILVSVVAFSLVALAIGIRNGKAGGSAAPYGVAALVAIVVGCVVMMATGDSAPYTV